MNEDFEKQLKIMKELCKRDGVAITIWANKTWQQLGGITPLYDFRNLIINSKRSLCETIRKLRMDLDASRELDTGEKNA